MRAWLTAIELQTPHRLKSFVFDNGELATSQIKTWCTDRGALHLFTAPYTSEHALQHMGRVFVPPLHT
jgi:hypothetical protein